jgi:hypothetical protein
MLGEVRQILRTLLCWGAATPEQLQRFRVETARAGVVFGSDAAEYINEIYLRGKLLSDAAV